MRQQNFYRFSSFWRSRNKTIESFTYKEMDIVFNEFDDILIRSGLTGLFYKNVIIFNKQTLIIKTD